MIVADSLNKMNVVFEIVFLVEKFVLFEMGKVDGYCYIIGFTRNILMQEYFLNKIFTTYANLFQCAHVFLPLHPHVNSL